MRMIGKATAIILAAALSLTMVACGDSSTTMSKHEGTWKVQDTAGQDFEIVLVGDGTAKANRSGEDMAGTWKEEDEVVVIEWADGWTTVIAEEDGVFTKKAYDKGVPRDGPPSNTSTAEKTK